MRLLQGQLRDERQVRLLLDQQEVPVQASRADDWPDGSIRELELNFNSSIGALAQLKYRLEFGGGIRAQPIQAERLDVVTTAGGFQVGKLRFSRQPAALLESVAFGREIIGDGSNAVSVTEVNGQTHLLDGDVSVEVAKSGPLAVQIRYAGELKLAADYAARFVITIEIPNTKSWVKYRAQIEDPGSRIRELALHSSFNLGSFPWTWDFGTGSWSYGVFRNTGDTAALQQKTDSSGSDWQILAGPAGQEQLQERAAGGRPPRAEGWGHLQGADRSIAFAVENFGETAGEYAIKLDGSGQLLFRHSQAQPAKHHELVVYQHYVASPVPVGAATSPVAMSSPLVVFVEGAATELR